MKIAIIGTGGVGGYFGARLAKAGFNVIFLARGAHLKALKNNGIYIKSIDGDFKINPVKATGTIEDIGMPDLIIVAVKAWQVKEVASGLCKIIHNNTRIIPLQNGVLAAEELGDQLNRKYILGGLCRILSKIESPGVINHFGVNPTIVFGELDKSVSVRS